MLERIRSIIRTANRSIFVGERYERNMRNLARKDTLVLLLCMVMTLVNFVQKDYRMMFSPLIFSLCTIASWYLVRARRCRTASVVLSVIGVTIILTYDVLVIPNGFAFLWTMPIPLVMFYFWGLKGGLFLTAYFQILFTFAFYTPFRHRLAYAYTPIVMDRFPILYFFNALITAFVMYEYHKSVLAEIDYADKMKEEVERQTATAVRRGDKLERLSNQMVETLARTIDAKDKYTNGHSFRVMRYAVTLAQKLGWDETRIAELRREALLHDIGKIGIPDAVLNKPGRLTEEEYRVIQSHTTIGWNILSGLEGMRGAASVAGCHHEHYDGGGYPSGLSGTDIPEHARIVAIADAYDAMHSDRIYRSAVPDEDILREFRNARGLQFDPVFLDAFLEILESGEL